MGTVITSTPWIHYDETRDKVCKALSTILGTEGPLTWSYSSTVVVIIIIATTIKAIVTITVSVMSLAYKTGRL